jgi:hypothetical protein
LKHAVPPLSDEIRRLLEIESGAPPVSDEVRARVMARAAIAFRDGGVAPVRRLFRRHVTLLVAAALGVLVALGALAAYRWAGTSLRGTDTSGASRAVASAPPFASHLKAPPGPSSELALSARAAETPAVSPKAPEPSAAARRPSPDETYSLELALLQRARAAVAKGDHSAALAAIVEHQRRFPTGRLREEREALRVRALAGLGRNDEARRAAERFKAEFPRSVLSSSMEQTSRPLR